MLSFSLYKTPVLVSYKLNNISHVNAKARQAAVTLTSLNIPCTVIYADINHEMVMCGVRTHHRFAESTQVLWRYLCAEYLSVLGGLVS